MELQRSSLDQRCLLVENSEQSLSDVLNLMEQHDASSLLLMHHGRPRNLVSRLRLQQMARQDASTPLADLPLPPLPNPDKVQDLPDPASNGYRVLPIQAFYDEEQRLYLANLEALLQEHQGNLRYIREQLFFSQHFFRQTGHAIIVVDAQQQIMAINPSFEHLFNAAADTYVGQSVDALRLWLSEQQCHFKLPPLPMKGTEELEVESLADNGERLHLQLAVTSLKAGGQQGGYYVLLLKDISELKARQSELNNLAYYDTGSKLPNQLLLNRRIDSTLKGSQTGHGLILIGLENLDHFGEVLGVELAEQLLFYAGGRLRALASAEVTVARNAPAELTLFCPDLNSSGALQALADKVEQTFCRPFLLGGHALNLKCSLGLYLTQASDASASDVQQRARLAQRHAQSNELSRQVYAGELHQQISSRFVMESGLRQALAAQQLELFYQPRYDTRSHTLLGAEALMRWYHPERGLVPPNEFIPLAEENGLIDALGLWALNEACLQWLRWRDSGLLVPRMAVNVSALQLRKGQFAADVRQVLIRTGMPAQHLELELTESCFIENLDEVRSQLIELAALGIRLAIDDFGTGFSNLSYLHHLPVHNLKIDRSFLTALDKASNIRSILKATIDMAHSLGLDVTAEGVETGEQMTLLRKLGCDEVQGYYFSRPLPASDLQLWLQPTDIVG